MVHVCFALHDKTGRYSKFAGTAICSMFENTSTLPRSITVYILHDNTLTDNNRDKFICLAKRYNQLVEFYNVEEVCADKLANYLNLFPAIKSSRVSVAAIYRILIPQIFSGDINKVIYFDSDIIINLDINELWNIELGDKIIAATPEMEILSDPSYISIKYLVKRGLVTYEDYFNSGVLVMNLKQLRQSERLIIKGIKWRNKHTQCECFDQDILNYLFSQNYIKLHEKFDVFIDKARMDSRLRPAIYHYVRNTLQLDLIDPFNKLWMDYFTKTPWFDSSIIDNLCKSIDSFGEIRRNSFIEFSTVMSGKTRVFVIDDKKVTDWLKRTYFVRDDEEIFIYENEYFLQNLIDEMNISHGKKIFFIRVNNQLIESLKKAGFIEDKDFFNHYTLFSPQLLTKIDVQSLIKAM